MKLKEALENQQDYVVALRREFHRHPEPSWQEKRTSARIKEELDKFGIPWRPCAGTGVVATIKGGAPGKTAALRADMDALQVDEQNEVPYRSKNPGIMHACGHDGHTAMLLGAARALAAVKEDLKGTVRLLFQPAEETGGGAKRMIEEGALEGVDAILGIHLWNSLPAGRINIEAGPRMASGDKVIIEFIGRGGHGSLPNQTVDPVVAASAFIMNSQALLSREKSPLESVVFTIGEFKAGTRFNVIPERARLEGTYRCFSEENRKLFADAITRYAKGTAELYRAKADVTIQKVMPATVNDPAVSAIARAAAEKTVGPSRLPSQEKTTGSEDMAYYLQAVPGAIAFVGSGFEEEGLSHPHHHPKFDIDETSLAHGTGLYARFAWECLNLSTT